MTALVKLAWSDMTPQQKGDEVRRLMEKNSHLSANDIAVILHAPGRNAVMGIIHRQKIKGPRSKGSLSEQRAKARARPRAPRPATAPKPRATLPRPPDAPMPHTDAWTALPGPTPVPLDEHPNGCRWPIGDPLEPGFGFCNAEAEGIYCGTHAARAGRSTPP